MRIAIKRYEGDKLVETTHEAATNVQFTQLGFLRVTEDSIDYNYAINTIVCYEQDEQKILTKQ